MNYANLIDKLQVLPEGKQLEVLDFIDYLADRFGRTSQSNVMDWPAAEFSELSISQAMRGLEDETMPYTEADIKERWQ